MSPDEKAKTSATSPLTGAPAKKAKSSDDDILYMVIKKDGLARQDVKQAIDDKINEYMSGSFDISDWQTEIRDLVDVDSLVEEHLKDNLHDEVQTAIQGLSFTVEVSTR